MSNHNIEIIKNIMWIPPLSWSYVRNLIQTLTLLGIGLDHKHAQTELDHHVSYIFTVMHINSKKYRVKFVDDDILNVLLFFRDNKS